METEQTLRRRIKTVADLHAIVRTMKALSAVSVRQYETVLKSVDDYSQTLELGLQAALQGGTFEKPGREPIRTYVAAVIFGSDVGLCGRFNEELIATALDCMNRVQVPSSARHVLAVGSRIAARLSELDHPFEETLMTPSSAAGIGDRVKQILDKIDDWHAQAIEPVMLFYSQAGSPRSLQLLPIDPAKFQSLAEKPWPNRVLPTFTTDSERLLAALIRQYLFITLFRCCAESLASEHIMRLKTTQAAEKNIQERHDELIAEYRTRRQDAIDAELLDIGAGFEAVSETL